MSAKGEHRPRRTAFFHTPKAAGNTILAVTKPDYRFGHGPYEGSREAFERQVLLVRSRAKRDTWESVFKFTFVRNPWDRMVSQYFHIMSARVTNDLADAAEDSLPGHFRKWLSYEGVQSMQTQCGKAAFCHHGPQVDFIGQYEHLRRDLDTVAQMTQRPLIALVNGELPKVNWGKKRPDFSWEKYYDENSRNLVAAFHLFEIKKFGYRFADPCSRTTQIT